MSLVIFDLDNTLIAGDSDYLWGEFLVKNQYVDVEDFTIQNTQFFEDYQKGTLDITAYQEFALAPLSKQSMATLTLWHKQFMQTFIEPIFLPKAQALVNKHKLNGDRVVIITATNTFITRPIGLRYGITELLGTNGEIINNRYTGEIEGIPTFQQGKVTRLNQWLRRENESIEGSYCYTDSHNDLPLLEIVEHAIVVDADDTLKQIAQARHWPSISFR